VRSCGPSLSLQTPLTLKVKKSLNFLSGYTETSSIHNRTVVNFVFENVDMK
jgi:hypothetical protein